MTEYGLQLYSVRDAMEKDLPGTLRAVAEMGYKKVEFAGYFGYSAEDIKKILADNGLKVCGTHTGFSALQPDALDGTLAFNKALGNKNIIIPSAPIGGRFALAKTIKRINELVPLLKKQGFTLSYHNHSAEFKKKLFCPVPHDEMQQKTDINFEIDTYWAYAAGVDPIELMTKLKDRIVLIHLKDGVLTKGCEGKSLGQGTATVKEVLAYAEKAGFEIVVESEGLEPDGLSEVKRCIDFLLK